MAPPGDKSRPDWPKASDIANRKAASQPIILPSGLLVPERVRVAVNETGWQDRMQCREAGAESMEIPTKVTGW